MLKCLFTFKQQKRLKTWPVFIAIFLAVSVLDLSYAGNREEALKAVYIYNFTKFISWPDQLTGAPSTPTRICVLGNDPVGEVLNELIQQKKQEQQLVLNTGLKLTDNLARCHILYVSSNDETQLPLLFNRLKGSHVLTVSDIPRFAQRGGMTGFTIEQNRLIIELNLHTAKEAGLNISAKLVEVCRLIP